MALNNLGLGFVFTARDLASAKMQRLERRFHSLDERVTGSSARITSSFIKLGVGLAAFTVSAAGVAGSLALANAAGRFGQGLAAVAAVTRATTNEMAMLRDAAIEAGINTQFSPDEAVAGLQSLATAGQTATQATATLVPVLDLATGSLGQLGVAEAAEAVVGTLNAYGMAANAAGDVTDKLLRVTQLTNFQTRDFEAGLSKAAATGSVFGQSLDDVLITMGLLRNRNIDASSAATAFREATRRVGAESRAQQAIQGAGVDIFDKTSGKMRSIVDIMNDFAQTTAAMSDAEKNRRVATAFGARGLLAFNAVQNASYTTTKNGIEITHKGAAAIENLREQLSQAENTAGDFRRQLLDTFAGQKTLLKGTLQTLAVVLGEPFAKVLKPIVGALVDALNALLRIFRDLPMPIKKAFASLIVAASAITALIGGVIAAKAGIALLVIGLKAVGLSIGGILATILPAILVVGALAAAVVGLKIAFEKNLGGIGDFFRKIGGQIRLGFQAMMQIFKQGGFSGAVREELAQAENQGLRRFVITVFQTAFRIKKIWTGFKDGFTQTIEAARPVFEDLVASLRQLGSHISGIFSRIAGSSASLPSARFQKFGQLIGSIIAIAVKTATQFIAIFTRVSTGIMRGFSSMKDYIGPAVTSLKEAFSKVGAALQFVIGSSNNLTKTTNNSTSSWIFFGEIIGKIIGGFITIIIWFLSGVVTMYSKVLWIGEAVKYVLRTVTVWIYEIGLAIYNFFAENVPSALSSASGSINGFFSSIGQMLSDIKQWFSNIFTSIVSGITSAFTRAYDFIQGIISAIKRALVFIGGAISSFLQKIPGFLLPDNLDISSQHSYSLSSESQNESPMQTQMTWEPTAMTSMNSSPMPSVVAAQIRHADSAAMQSSIDAFIASQTQLDNQEQPMTINVQVDGETIATASHNAARDLASRSFAPVPSY